MKILLSFFYFFYFSVVGVYIIFMPKVLSALAYTPFEIGVIFSAGPLVRFILPMLFMRGLALSRALFNSALLIMVVSSVAFYLSIENFYALLFSNIAIGFGMSLTLPYIEVISLESIGKERYGKIRLFGSVGFVLVSLVLVEILSSPYVALNFLVVLMSVTALVAFIITRESAKEKEDESSSTFNDIDILHDWQLWLGLTMMQVSFGSFYNFFTIYSTDNGISMQNTIYLWSFGVVVEIIMLYVQGRFLKGSLLAILRLTTFMTALRWLLVFLFSDNLMMLYFSQSIHALSFALFHSGAISYLHSYYKHKALAQQFFSGITYGLGGLSGALISGYIYEYYSEYLFLSSAIMALLAFISLSSWSRRVEFLGTSQNS